MKRLVTVVALVLAALVSIDAYQHQASALPAGLVAAYSFSEGTGATTGDHSGLNNPGAVSGATWSTAGKYGGALSFDGIDDIVTVNDAASLDLTNGMTLSAWVKPTTLTGYKSVIMKERPGNLTYALYANTTANRPVGEITNTANREAAGTAKVATNAWTYLTTTYNGSQLRLYVNGSLVRTLATTGNLVVSGNVLTIGGNGVWSNEFFNGLIDEVRVYNRALSATEITSDMNTALVDTTAPTVSVIGPAASPALTGVVTITASATDSSGVAGVQFFINGAPAGGEDTSSPYSYSWDTRTVINGAYALTARARDTVGNQATSAAVNRTVNNPVDTTLPAVSITAPTPATPLSGIVSITASATDNVGVAGVQFLVDGLPVSAEDTTSPYAYSWDTTTVANGSHALTARARDLAGNLQTSTAINVNVQNGADTTPPSVSITAPPATPALTGTVSITANAADNVGVAGVTFLVNGAPVGSEDTSSPYSYSWNTTTVVNGAYALTARARDAAGNLTTSAAVNVTVANTDLTAPTVSITAPAATPPLSGTVSVTADAADNLGVAGVQFLINGTPAGAEDTSSPYAYNWDTAAGANGSYALTARARDAAGNQTTSAAVTVTVSNGDVTPPTVSVTGPPATPALTGTVSFTANAADNAGVAGVTFLVDGQPVGVEDTGSPYSYSWDTTTATNGPHALTARARDAAGNLTTSAAVNVTVSNDVQPPAVSITTPVAGANVSGNVAVEATASDDIGIAGVQFKLDGANHGAEDTIAPYTAVWNSTGAAFGSHSLTAVARDASGKSSTSAAVAVNIIDPNGEAAIGSWSPVVNWPLVAVHTVLMPNGNILMWDAWEMGTTTARVWNPATNQFTNVFIDSQIFCAAQSYLPDGKILVTGGHDGGGTGIVDASVFNPATNSWTRLADMELPRWYPSSVTLGMGASWFSAVRSPPGFTPTSPRSTAHTPTPG